MTRYVGDISKTVALLAVLLLPVQQLFAATCCCRQGNVAKHKADVAKSCCSVPHADCCDTDSAPSRACCQDDTSDGNSKTCRCIVCGLSDDTYSNVESPTTGVSSPDEGKWAAASVSSGPACRDLGCHLSATADQLSTLNAADRCHVLCRYRL